MRRESHVEFTLEIDSYKNQPILESGNITIIKRKISHQKSGSYNIYKKDYIVVAKHVVVSKYLVRIAFSLILPESSNEPTSEST